MTVDTAKCTACGRSMDGGADRCLHCGAVHGEHLRCPHCRALAGVEPSAALRFVCSLCGRPRVPVTDRGLVRASVPEKDALARAGVARAARIAWRTAAAASSGFGAFSIFVLVLVVLVAEPGFVAGAIAAAATAVPFLFALYALRRGAKNGHAMQQALDEGWSEALSDLARHRGGELDATTIAHLTGIDATTADRLLSGLAAREVLRADVSHEGRLSYSAPDPARLAAAPERRG